MAGGVKTTCPYCGVGCGVIIDVDAAGAVSVSGDVDHPANLGRLCSKGTALGETVDLEGRLLAPQVDGRTTAWDTALDRVASAFSNAIAEHGPDSVAFYVSGQLLTEDYYVANKLMKGFIGSANIDTNSRLCMASSVAGHRRAFGTDTVPGTYEDLEQADAIVLVGSNLAWCHPVLYQRIVAAKKQRPDMQVVNVDPRRTATCDVAQTHLALAPGSDVALFNGLLRHLMVTGAIDETYTEAHVTGLNEALIAANTWTVPAVAVATGLSEAAVEDFYRLWTAREKVVTVYSQGVNQSSSGSDKVNAILNCHLATGRIGRPGMGPFSVTGQPNAMGGREVGGLANMLACHLNIEDAAHRAAVQSFWQSPTISPRAGLKAIDLFEACADGRIKALWIMSTNPAVSMPDADKVRDAIKSVPFVAVSDLFAETDTARLAHVVLPASGWGEKSGTVTNSERRISRQRAFLPTPGQARPDWRIICDVAARMGWGEDFAFAGPADILREHAALSILAGKLGGDFDIGALAVLSDEAYDALPPTLWPVPLDAPAEPRFFAEGGFFHPDGKARMLPLEPKPFAKCTGRDAPLRLLTGRVRDHWHTMTRTARSARLSQHMAEPYAEIHPTDACAYGISPADLVVVESDTGSAIVRAVLTERVPVGSIFIPMHWTSQWSSRGRVCAVVAAAVDPVSGQPELKGSVARIRRLDAAWYGFAVSTEKMDLGADYWAVARSKNGWRVELADSQIPLDWESHARGLLNIADGEVVSVVNPRRGIARIAIVKDGVVLGALFTAKEPVEVSRGHVVRALGDAEGLNGLLAGRPGQAQPDPGPTVCACFDVGVNTILRAIAEQGLTSVEAIGAALHAGTNCGSCRPELQALLANATAQEAAE